MITCAKAGIVQPRINPTLLFTHIEPKNTKQDLKDPTWLLTMKSEYDSLMKNQTWILTPLPPSRSATACKRVFRIKENPDGSINRHKAKLVAKGFHQRLGYDYNETFSHAIKLVTVKLILTLLISGLFNS